MTVRPTTDRDLLAERFEAHRGHLRAVAYRMLGSTAEADDAVQDAWLRLGRSDVDAVDNLAGWLTTVVARLCLDRLRARRARPEAPLTARIPDPVVSTGDDVDPEQHVLLADSIGLAMLVVLETLSPAERLAFVLHDTFGLPFDQIAPIVERSPAATRQLASRARRRVRGATPFSPVAPARQREIVEAFIAASRAGDFEALLRILDPDVVIRADLGAPGTPFGPIREVRGARAVASQALAFRRIASSARIVTVNGSIGVLAFAGDRPYAVLAVAFRNDRIAEIDIVAAPERLAALDLSAAVRRSGPAVVARNCLNRRVRWA